MSARKDNPNPGRGAVPGPVSRPELDRLRERVAQLVLLNPQKAATILTAWMHSNPLPKKKVG